MKKHKKLISCMALIILLCQNTICPVSAQTTTTLPSAYMNDLDKLIDTYPKTKCQTYNTCWAYSAIGLAEFDLIRDGLYDKNLDLSELQLAYFTYHHVTDPLGGTVGDWTGFRSGHNYLEAGGHLFFSARALMQWKGVAMESDLPCSQAQTSHPIDQAYAYDKTIAHLQNVYLLDIHKEPQAVKQMIMEHGAVGIGIYFVQSIDDLTRFVKTVPYHGTQAETYYCNDPARRANHAVNIVGWDDDFPAENFASQPEGNGAWLIRNSWSEKTGFSKESYCWISYYDTSIDDEAWAYDFESADNYDYNYQYDGGICCADAYRLSTSANVFTVHAAANELLEAVSVSLTCYTNVPYTIRVYTDLITADDPRSGQLAATVEGKTTSKGIYTIPLKNAVTLAKGSKFSVVVELGIPDAGVDVEICSFKTYIPIQCKVFMNPKQSYCLYKGKWLDLYEQYSAYRKTGNLCIKAYTSELGGDTVSPVKQLKKKSAGKHDITLSWGKVSGANGYEIYRSTSKNGTYQKIKTITSASKTSYKDTKLSKNKNYYYRIRAYKNQSTDGGTKNKTVGLLSSAVKVKTAK